MAQSPERTRRAETSRECVIVQNQKSLARIVTAKRGTAVQETAKGCRPPCFLPFVFVFVFRLATVGLASAYPSIGLKKPEPISPSSTLGVFVWLRFQPERMLMNCGSISSPAQIRNRRSDTTVPLWFCTVNIATRPTSSVVLLRAIRTSFCGETTPYSTNMCPLLESLTGRSSALTRRFPYQPMTRKQILGFGFDDRHGNGLLAGCYFDSQRVINSSLAPPSRHPVDDLDSAGGFFPSNVFLGPTALKSPGRSVSSKCPDSPQRRIVKPGRYYATFFFVRAELGALRLVGALLRCATSLSSLIYFAAAFASAACSSVMPK